MSQSPAPPGGQPRTIALVLHPRLPAWQAANVAAFLASGLAADGSGILGQSYEDGQGNRYCRLFNQPVMVFQAAAGQLRELLALAKEKGLLISLFSAAMMKTNTDAANRATIASVATNEMELLGLAVLGPKPCVAKLLKGVSRHE